MNWCTIVIPVPPLYGQPLTLQGYSYTFTSWKKVYNYFNQLFIQVEEKNIGLDPKLFGCKAEP